MVSRTPLHDDENTPNIFGYTEKKKKKGFNDTTPQKKQTI